MAKYILKCLASGLIILAVLFPHPILFCKQVVNYTRGVPSLVDSHNPALSNLVQEAHRYKLKEEPAKVINYIVAKHIKYEGNFQTWGVAEYWPTVTELLQKGKGNCIGIAVVTASLATQLGYTNYDFASTRDHMWVRFHYPTPLPPRTSIPPAQVDPTREASNPGKPSEAPVERQECAALTSALETLRYIGLPRSLIILGLLLLTWIPRPFYKLWT